MTRLALTSPAFARGATIPAVHTCTGDDLSPPLRWEGVPEGTASFALTCVDPDAPMGDWVHWLAWDIPGRARALPQGIPPQAQLPNRTRQANNDFGRVGYGGPCPPPGHGSHRYFFTLYALSCGSLNLSGRASCDLLERAVQRFALGQAKLMGRFQR